MSCLRLHHCQGDLMAASAICEWRGARPCHCNPSVYPACQQGGCHAGGEESRRRRSSVDACLSACLSVSVDMLSGVKVTGQRRWVEGWGGWRGRVVRRTRRAANLPGHLARLTLFKQVPRRLVSCLVKWLTFWFNQHPRLPDELDHYQKCTGSAMSLTCQNQTRLLIYLLHSPWERSIVALCGLKVACPWCFVKLGWVPGTSLILSLARIILETQNGGPRKKNKHGIPASILNEDKPFSTGPLCIEISTFGCKFICLKVIDRYVFFSRGVGDKEARLMLATL